MPDDEPAEAATTAPSVADERRTAKEDLDVGQEPFHWIGWDMRPCTDCRRRLIDENMRLVRWPGMATTDKICVQCLDTHLEAGGEEPEYCCLHCHGTGVYDDATPCAFCDGTEATDDW